jgi:hypothetical protein
MSELSHLRAIEARLNREKTHLFHAVNEKERVFRETQVKQAQKELDGEKPFLAKKGIVIPEEIDMSDDELLKELMA